MLTRNVETKTNFCRNTKSFLLLKQYDILAILSSFCALNLDQIKKIFKQYYILAILSSPSALTAGDCVYVWNCLAGFEAEYR